MTLNQLTLTEAITLLRQGSISSVDLVNDCLKAIRRYNQSLNAYLTLNPQAFAQAKKIGKSKPDADRPLLGIPVAVKDNFLTQGLRTTASSLVLKDYLPQYSATVVGRLEKAGAIVLGKTNMDAWAHGSSTETSDFGPTKNPWNLDHVPGGSSGGSAAAVIADLCLSAIGSETAISVRGPAAWCGCVGLKPTYGRVSRYGLIAMSSSLDSPGPLTKTVPDAALLLEILAGKDPYDATTLDAPVENYSTLLSRPLKGLKIGIVNQYLLKDMNPQTKTLVLKAAQALAGLGAEVDYADTLDPAYAVSVYTIIQRSDVSSNLSRYDGIRYGNGRTYFRKEAKRRITLGTFSLSEGYAEKYYKKAQKVRTMFIEDFRNVFHRFDLLLGPTMPGPAPKLGASEDQAMFGEMADLLGEPSSIAGLPGINLPCGFVNSLPVGLNLFGPQLSEAVLLNAAAAYEQATAWHKRKPEAYQL